MILLTSKRELTEQFSRLSFEARQALAVDIQNRLIKLSGIQCIRIFYVARVATTEEFVSGMLVVGRIVHIGSPSKSKHRVEDCSKYITRGRIHTTPDIILSGWQDTSSA